MQGNLLANTCKKLCMQKQERVSARIYIVSQLREMAIFKGEVEGREHNAMNKSNKRGGYSYLVQFTMSLRGGLLLWLGGNDIVGRIWQWGLVCMCVRVRVYVCECVCVCVFSPSRLLAGAVSIPITHLVVNCSNVYRT